MTIAELPRLLDAEDDSKTSISWWDSDAECTLVMAEPAADPDLWQEYLAGAARSYRRHGVGAAFDADTVDRANDTALFWAALDPTGRVVGGVRAVGPLGSPEDSHAVVEWAGQPGLPLVRKMIADRAPLGILEMKSAWVTDDPNRNRELTKPLARSAFHAMALLGVQFCMATSAAHALERWRSSGGVVAPVGSTPYPDERYVTKMMWWDRSTFANHAQPDQLAKILSEMKDVRRYLHSQHSTTGVASTVADDKLAI